MVLGHKGKKHININILLASVDRPLKLNMCNFKNTTENNLDSNALQF